MAQSPCSVVNSPDGFEGATPVGATGPCLPTPSSGFPPVCCNSASPSLPAFPGVAAATGVWSCFTSCGPGAVYPGSYTLSAPTLAFGACDIYLMNLSVNFDSTGGAMSGQVIAKYARTFNVTCGGICGQVWRFLINVDTSVSPGGPNPICPEPECSGSGPVHWFGYVDYACFLPPCPSTPPGTWSTVLNLNHMPGVVSHGPTSTRPLVAGGHPDMSYHFVSPSNFNFWTAPGPATTVINSLETRVTLLGPTFQASVDTCLRESGKANIFPAGQIAPIEGNLISVCRDAETVPAWKPYNLIGLQATCISVPNGAGGMGLIYVGCPPGHGLPLGLWSMPLGSFGSGATYPYSSDLFVWWGCLTHQQTCTQELPESQDVVCGIQFEHAMPPTTNFEMINQVVMSTPIVSRRLIDLQNSIILGLESVGWGSAFRSSYIVGLNL